MIRCNTHFCTSTCTARSSSPSTHHPILRNAAQPTTPPSPTACHTRRSRSTPHHDDLQRGDQLHHHRHTVVSPPYPRHHHHNQQRVYVACTFITRNATQSPSTAPHARHVPLLVWRIPLRRIPWPRKNRDTTVTKNVIET